MEEVVVKEMFGEKYVVVSVPHRVSGIPACQLCEVEDRCSDVGNECLRVEAGFWARVKFVK